MEKRKYWGDKYAPRSIAKESTWINSVKEFVKSLANQHLQKRCDLNAERRVTRRINALETSPIGARDVSARTPSAR
ncbi:MAG: hypothetical protein U0X87_11675 [Anaerolineales bacterium]